MAICKITDCDRPVAGRGWCKMHWKRWRTNGDPLKIKLPGVDWQVKGKCSICGKPVHAHGFCSKHLSRYLKTGDPLKVSDLRGRPLSGEQPGYDAVHRRLRRSRGPAKNFACVDCGKPATGWSYDNSDPAELRQMVRGRILAYSLDPARYQPRCTGCHRKFDRAAEQRQRDRSGRFMPRTEVAIFTADTL